MGKELAGVICVHCKKAATYPLRFESGSSVESCPHCRKALRIFTRNGTVIEVKSV